MSKKKYYAVAKGYRTGIFSTWEECKEQVNGYSGAVYKSFDTEKEAQAFIDGNEKIQKKGKICILCSKPSASRCEICFSCLRKKNALEKKLNKRISNDNLYFLTEKYITSDIFGYVASDVFDLLEKDPSKYREATRVEKSTKRKLKKDHKEYSRENTKIKSEETIPSFVYSLLGPTKQVIKVSGERNNPHIIYKCKLCGETLYTRYNDYLTHSGHDCSSIKSSGEQIVGDYLKNHGIKYKSQRDTLKCINPETGNVMPYDFELTGKKVLIEVQGEQHKRFIPRFHVSQEGFDYQKKKDLYKKEFAEKNGYRLIEIWYEDLTEEKLQLVFGKFFNSMERKEQY